MREVSWGVALILVVAAAALLVHGLVDGKRPTGLVVGRGLDAAHDGVGYLQPPSDSQSQLGVNERSGRARLTVVIGSDRPQVFEVVVSEGCYDRVRIGDSWPARDERCK